VGTLDCPTIFAFKEVLHEQANAMNPYQRRFFLPYHDTYNHGCNNNPFFRWRNESNSKQHPQRLSSSSSFMPSYKMTLEETSQTFTQVQSNFNNQTMQAINDLSSSVSELTFALRVQEKCKFPTQPNRRGQLDTRNLSASDSQVEHVKSITTLCSGKEIDKTIPMMATNSNDHVESKRE